jgi:hypothetical protein
MRPTDVTTSGKMPGIGYPRIPSNASCLLSLEMPNEHAAVNPTSFPQTPIGACDVAWCEAGHRKLAVCRCAPFPIRISICEGCSSAVLLSSVGAFGATQPVDQGEPRGGRITLPTAKWRSLHEGFESGLSGHILGDPSRLRSLCHWGKRWYFC